MWWVEVDEAVTPVARDLGMVHRLRQSFRIRLRAH
jgi:hypothetical protein